MKLLIRWAIIALSLFVAAWFLPGIRVLENGWVVYAATAAILGVINLAIKPVLKFFALPLILITFGLFTLVINAAMLWLASYIAVQYFKVGFFVDDFASAFWGALIVSVVSTVLTQLFEDKESD